MNKRTMKRKKEKTVLKEEENDKSRTEEIVYLKKYPNVINTFLALFTLGMVIITFWMSHQQGNYYRATIRPFVNIADRDSVSFKGSSDIEYIIKNFGSIPAKDVQGKAFFCSFEDSTYKLKFNDKNVKYSIYPNQEFLLIGKNLSKEMEETSFLHIAIVYKDMDGNLYNSLSIFKYSIDKISNESKFTPLNRQLHRQLVKSYFD